MIDYTKINKEEKEIKLATEEEINRLFNPKRGRPENVYGVSGYKCEINTKEITEFERGFQEAKAQAKLQQAEFIEKLKEELSDFNTKEFYTKIIDKTAKEVFK